MRTLQHIQFGEQVVVEILCDDIPFRFLYRALGTARVAGALACRSEDFSQ